MYILYKIGIELYYLLIRLSIPFSSRARRWYNGRKEFHKKRFSTIPDNKQLIWFHASSLGEYEQGLPIIEKWRMERPDDFILLSFYSPSGYDIQKENKLVDRVVYLPVERTSEIKQFLDTYKPVLAVFIKYEIWPVLLKELRKKEVPTYLISAVFRKNQAFFKFYGKWYLSILKDFAGIFVQDEVSFNLLDNRGIHNVEVYGDSRIDRVLEIVDEESDIPGIRDFKQDSKIIIAGSSWQVEEEYLQKFFTSGLPEEFKLIIAPHDVGEKHVLNLKNQFGEDLITYGSLLENQEAGKEKRILLIDRVGILSRIYRYCDISFIGGGFGSGLHNILEPAAHGLPVIFGSRYINFIEANDLIKIGGAFSVESYEEFEQSILLLINDENTLSTACKGCREYVNKSKGVSSLITSQLLEKVQH